MSGLKYWLWLTTRQGLDAAGVLTVLDYFVTPERAYYADREEYDQLPLAPKARSGLYSKELDSTDRILGDCQRLSLRIMTLRDGDYPERLRQISAPPAVLYVRGKLFDFDEEAAIAVVGSRRPSQYGEMAAAKLGMELAAGGALVLSGIAEGLDTCALKGALKAGGPVVSVLGGGIDVPYPAVNRYLYEDVAAAGALISEYPPGTEPKGFHFPRRNRILSGLALGVLAVECKLHSGTMSTVRHAMDQDRDIFAIPGAIDAPMSEGTNWLIQQGAKLVTRGEDILEEYRSRFPGRLGRREPLSPQAVQQRLEVVEQETVASVKQEMPDEEQKPHLERVPRTEQADRFTDDQLAILRALGEENCSTDELVERTGIPARRILSALTMLQVERVVEESAGRRFSALLRLET